MAERRMFAKTIIDSDAFLDMPHSTQLLYFHLSMRADDDGFINNPKNIMRTVGCKDDDFKILITKKFIIPFESGVVVIKHWKIHNYIRNDRYKETKYKIEKSMLSLDENNSYKKTTDTNGIPDGYQMDTQVRLGKDSIGYINNNKESEEKLQILFIECTGSTNMTAITECLSFLEELPFEVIEYVLRKTAGIQNPNWNYAKTILNDWSTRKIDTIEKAMVDDKKKNSNNKNEKETKEYEEVTFESEEDYQNKLLGKE